METRHETTLNCSHAAERRSAHAGVAVTICADCPRVRFEDLHGEVRPTVALARLFGEFDLVGGLAAVAAPGREVLMYRAPDGLVRAALRVLDPHRWYRADEYLWVSHDENHLLFSHNDPVVTHLIGA